MSKDYICKACDVNHVSRARQLCIACMALENNYVNRLRKSQEMLGTPDRLVDKMVSTFRRKFRKGKWKGGLI